MQKWVKIRNRPDQIRGEGVWCKIENVECTESEWRMLRDTGALPVAEQEEKPT